MPIRQGVVLVGGLGRRLGALTRATPKPMIDVGGRPFIEHVIAHLARFGLTDILLLAGYRGHEFMSAYAARELYGVRLSVIEEPEPLGTGGALRFAAGLLAPSFVLANGDTFFDADLLPLLSLASRRRCTAMLLRRVDDASRYGQVLVGNDARITAFREKAPAGAGSAGPALINAGCYILDRDAVLAAIGPLPCSLETGVMPRLLASGTLYGIEGEGYFVDIGVPASLERARAELPRVRRRPAAFLDRDGVINIDHGYTHRIEEQHLVEDAPQAIETLNAAGYYTIVVSNQAGIARGFYAEAQARDFNQSLRERLMELGARIDAIYYCPHHPAGAVPEYTRACDCRKPAPGLLEQAARDWPIDIGQSFLVGDKPTDIEAARSFGIPGFLHAGGSLLETVNRALRAARE